MSSQNGQFAVVALVQNQGLLTAIPVSSGVSASPNTTFGHLAIGGGYSTVLALLNAGTSTLTGRVALSGQDGKPIPAHISDGQTSVVDSNLPVSIQAGGAKFLALNPVNDADPTRVAWANVSSTGGALAGVATFQVTSSTGVLQTIAGVFPSAAATAATMVVDDSEGENRYTGFAIANPGASAVTVKIVEVEADGSSTTLLSPITVGPGQQVARFFFQDPQAKKTFQGSAAFIGQNGATFSLVGLVQNQGLLTAIPVTPAKAPNIN